MEIRVGYKIVFVVGMVLSIMLIAITFGCSTISGDRPGFVAGRLAGDAYIATEDAQPEEISLAIRSTYAILKGVVKSESDPVDAAVNALIADTYPDTTDAFRSMVFNFYSMARTRLDGVIKTNVDIPSSVILDNFVAGVESALILYKKGYAESVNQ